MEIENKQLKEENEALKRKIEELTKLLGNPRMS